MRIPHVLNSRFIVSSGLAVAVGSLLALQVQAAPIDPGFDLFQTGPGASIDIGQLGLGVVDLEGVQLPGAPLGADTIVARKDPGPPEGATTVIDIELVALHLVSTGPVDLTPLGGPFIGVFSDLYITLDSSDRFFTGGNPFPDGSGLGPSFFNLPVPDAPLAPSIGQMRMNHGGPGAHSGGTFSSCFGTPGDEITGNCQDPSQIGLGVLGGGIFADAIFTVVGGDPTNPLDLLVNVAAPQISLGGIGTFEHLSGSPQFPSGDFVVTSITHIGPHPVDPISIPEPTTGLLIAAGLALGIARRRS